MKKLTFLGLMLFACLCTSQQLKAQEVQPLLEQNIVFSHNQENWFPPISVAVDGLTDEQASFKGNSVDHSIAELVSHLVFWNERMLKAMKGEEVPQFDGNNDATFTAYSEDDFGELAGRLDQILTGIEEVSRDLNPEQMKGWAATLANIASHNAYHTGQMVFIRKQNGWWR